MAANPFAVDMYVIALVTDDTKDGRHDVLLLQLGDQLPLIIGEHERIMIHPTIFHDKKEAQMYKDLIMQWPNELRVVNPDPF